jgi:hypothetical protein
MSSPELHFAQQLDVPQQQSPDKYLRQQKILDGSGVIKGNKRSNKEISHHNISQTDSAIPIR